MYSDFNKKNPSELLITKKNPNALNESKPTKESLKTPRGPEKERECLFFPNSPSLKEKDREPESGDEVGDLEIRFGSTNSPDKMLSFLCSRSRGEARPGDKMNFEVPADLNKNGQDPEGKKSIATMEVKWFQGAKTGPTFSFSVDTFGSSEVRQRQTARRCELAWTSAAARFGFKMNYALDKVRGQGGRDVKLGKRENVDTKREKSDDEGGGERPSEINGKYLLKLYIFLIKI